MDKHFCGKARGAPCFVTAQVSEGGVEFLHSDSTHCVVKNGVRAWSLDGAESVAEPLGKL